MSDLTVPLVVTKVGSVIFLAKKHGRFRLIAPFLITSLPMSNVGGLLHLPKTAFFFNHAEFL